MNNQDLLQILPHFKDALKLPLKEYKNISESIFKNRHYCWSFMAKSIEKFNNWCEAMNCVDVDSKCIIPLHPLEKIKTISSPPSTLPLPSTTTSYLQMINSVGHNGTCYDDYFCQPQNVAFYLHLALGYLGLTLCLIGILLTILFIPALNISGNRTGATLYLTAMGIYDTIFLMLFTAIIVIRYLPSTYNNQLDMYSRFTAYLIPQGLPTMQMMELFSVWLTVALLVDRFMYLKLGFHSNLVSSRFLSAKVILVVTVLMVLYTVPKYLQFRLEDYPRIGMKKVMYTEVVDSDSFKNLLLHWLKVPIEMFLPYLGVGIFSVLNSIKFYDLMFKRKLSEASKAKRAVTTDTTLIQPSSFKHPCFIVSSDKPLLSGNLKSQGDRENLNVVITLIIGFSMLALKVPKFVLHALTSEQYVGSTSTKYFRPVTDFLDMIWVVSRPLIYLVVANHFREAVQMVYCRCCCGDNFITGGQYEVDAVAQSTLDNSNASIKLDNIAYQYLQEKKQLNMLETISDNDNNNDDDDNDDDDDTETEKNIVSDSLNKDDNVKA